MTTPRPQDTDPLRAKGTDRDVEMADAAAEVLGRDVWAWLESQPGFSEGFREGRERREPADFIVLSEQDYAALQSMGFRKDADGRYLSPHEPYPGWSTPPGPLSRLVAWVRKWRRP